MYEATDFETEKLTASIHAVLRWYGDDAKLGKSWNDNWYIDPPYKAMICHTGRWLCAF
jgi:hypothetical protein